MSLTKQDLEEIGKVVDTRLSPVRDEMKIGFVSVQQNIKEIKSDVEALREQIQSLTITLDKFLKRLTDREEGFAILKTEVDKIKSFLKEKFDVEIAAQS